MPLVQIKPIGQDLKIGDLARLTGKTQRALRLYEELGLLAPATHTQGGFRVYAADAVERVAWIGKLQDLGFTLHQIQELVDATTKAAADDASPKEGMGRVRALYEAKQRELTQQIERLQQLQRELCASLEYLEECVHDCQAAKGSCCSVCETHRDDDVPPLVEGIRS